MPRIIQLYEEHAAAWDAEFRRIRDRFGDRIRCGRGCAACCSHMFSISPLEAAAIAGAVARLPAQARDRLIGSAEAYLERAAGDGLRDDGTDAVTPRTGVRLPCPALDGDACSIYDARPLICRKWGIPVYDPAQPDRLHACELNFRAGDSLDAADIVAGQASLLAQWTQLKKDAAGEDLPRQRSTVAEAILHVRETLRGRVDADAC